MKTTQQLAGVASIFFVGVLVGFLVAYGIPASPDGDAFSVHVLNAASALKLNKRTGETWLFEYQTKTWKPMSSPSEVDRPPKFYADVKGIAVTIVVGLAAFLVGVFTFLARSKTIQIQCSKAEVKHADNPPPSTASSPESPVLNDMPESVEGELRSRAMDFVATEFLNSSQLMQKRAAKFIFDRIRLAARHHYAEQQTMVGFRDAEQLRLAAARFRELATSAD